MNDAGIERTDKCKHRCCLPAAVWALNKNNLAALKFQSDSVDNGLITQFNGDVVQRSQMSMAVDGSTSPDWHSPRGKAETIESSCVIPAGLALELMDASVLYH